VEYFALTPTLSQREREISLSRAVGRYGTIHLTHKNDIVTPFELMED
jgi:hypothetical protein